MPNKKSKYQLKLRIERSGKVTHRYLRDKEEFTVGKSLDNDITLLGQQFPKKHILIFKKDDYYVFRLQNYMNGEVWVGDSRLVFKDLITHDLLPRKGNFFLLKISEGKAGYLTFEDTRIDFSLDGSPEAFAPKFSGYSWYRTTLKSLVQDISFKLILIIFLLIHGFFLHYLSHIEVKERNPLNRREVRERFTKFILKAPPEPPVVPSEGIAAGKGEAETEAAKAKKSGASKKGSDAAREEKPPTVTDQGLLGLIAGVGATRKSSSVVDFLVDKGVVKELDEVLGKTDLKVGKGKNSEKTDFDQLIALSETGGIDELISDLDEVETVTLKKKGRVNIDRAGSITGTEGAAGQRDEQSMMDLVLAQMGRIQYTYNKYLKRDPGLRGKLEIEMTIAATGHVTNCRIVESTMNNPDFERDILAIFRRLKFNPISRGTVTVLYPLVFSKAEM